jgi:hypothetical protein
MMKTQAIFPLRGALCCAAVLIFSLSAGAHSSISRTPGQDNSKPKISEADAKAVKAIEAAPDVTAKLAAAEAFVKKSPKSPARQQLVAYIVDQIVGVSDPNQKLTLAQKFQTVFTEAGEANVIKSVEIDAYISLNKFDEAFAAGAAVLAKNPEDLQVLINLTITGTEQAKKQNTKYAKDAGQYGAKAIELLEADKKPANLDDLVWGRYKGMLPQLYQEMAIISFMKQDWVGAKSKVEKAMKLNPADPFNYVLHGSLINDEYQRMAVTHKSMPDGKAKDDMLQQATGLLDKIIDDYARAIALSEGKAQYQQLHDQLLPDLTSYYKYRHKNSSDGLQKLIDGYKLPANP